MPGHATMTFDDEDGLVVVIGHVPALVCDECGEAFAADAMAMP